MFNIIDYKTFSLCCVSVTGFFGILCLKINILWESCFFLFAFTIRTAVYRLISFDYVFIIITVICVNKRNAIENKNTNRLSGFGCCLALHI